jgi:hypothetical protein
MHTDRVNRVSVRSTTWHSPSSPSFVIVQQPHNTRPAAFYNLSRIIPRTVSAPVFSLPEAWAWTWYLYHPFVRSRIQQYPSQRPLDIECIERIAHVHSQHRMLGGDPGMAMRTAT